MNKEFVEKYIPFAQTVAKRLYYELNWKGGTNFDLDDFISYGIIGLIEASEKYNGKVKFETYARYRIRGTILDKLRRIPKLKTVPFPDYDIKDENAINPITLTEKNDFKEFLKRGLTKPEQMIIELYYYKRFTLKETRNVIGLSEGRIDQIHKNLKNKLESKFTNGA